MVVTPIQPTIKGIGFESFRVCAPCIMNYRICEAEGEKHDDFH